MGEGERRGGWWDTGVWLCSEHMAFLHEVAYVVQYNETIEIEPQ